MNNLTDLLLSNNPETIVAAAREFLKLNKREEATTCYKRLTELNNNDIESRFIYAHLVDDGTHKGLAFSRDLALSILNDFPAIFQYPQEGNCELIRFAAIRCSHIGPIDKAVSLLRQLAPLSGLAKDYFALSEILSASNDLQESISALEKAISLDPATYDTDANRETLKFGKTSLAPPLRKPKACLHKRKSPLRAIPRPKIFLVTLRTL